MPALTRCLSVRNPWADLIVRGYKSIENRSWRTNYRGRIAIHAATGEAWRNFVSFLEMEAPDETLQAMLAIGYEQPETDRYSAIVGSVELVDCNMQHQGEFKAKGFSLPEVAFADECSDYFWRLASPKLYAKPIPCGGKLNLWELTPALANAVERAENA
jgi:hypothetical protein